MIHDLRHPTIVIAGAFNPHIFAPQWIANVLFEIPEGQEVKGVLVTDLVTQTTRHYIDGIGILAEGNRLSLFIDSIDEAKWALAEAIVARVCEALPHTPVQGLGINFQFLDYEFDPAIADLLKQNDHPEKLGDVSEYTSSSRINIDAQTRLNLNRTINEALFNVRFNFHSDKPSMANVCEGINGRIAHCYQRAVNALTELYGVEPESITEQKALNENLGEES